MNPVFQNYRKQVVATIIQIQEHFDQVSRSSMFLAISIFDCYLQKIATDISHCFSTSKDAKPLAIACFFLAWKFQGDSHPKLKIMKQTLKIDLPQNNFNDVVFRFQEHILMKIDFSIPTTTAYEVLESMVGIDEFDNEQSRRNIGRTLKILLTAVLLTWEISFDPSLGSKIHQITKKTTQIDSKAKNIYRRCLKTIKSQQQVQNVVLIAAH